MPDYTYRYYDPKTGRWPSRDPIKEKGGINLYCYVLNNVVSEFDVLGMKVLIVEPPLPPEVGGDGNGDVILPPIDPPPPSFELFMCKCYTKGKCKKKKCPDIQVSGFGMHVDRDELGASITATIEGDKDAESKCKKGYSFRPSAPTDCKCIKIF